MVWAVQNMSYCCVLLNSKRGVPFEAGLPLRRQPRVIPLQQLSHKVREDDTLSSGYPSPIILNCMRAFPTQGELQKNILVCTTVFCYMVWILQI